MALIISQTKLSSSLLSPTKTSAPTFAAPAAPVGQSSIPTLDVMASYIGDGSTAQRAMQDPANVAESTMIRSQLSTAMPQEMTKPNWKQQIKTKMQAMGPGGWMGLALLGLGVIGGGFEAAEHLSKK